MLVEILFVLAILLAVALGVTACLDPLLMRNLAPLGFFAYIGFAIAFMWLEATGHMVAGALLLALSLLFVPPSTSTLDEAEGEE